MRPSYHHGSKEMRHFISIYIGGIVNISSSIGDGGADMLTS
jgi:hypothetical protein